MPNFTINNWIEKYPGIWESRPITAITNIGVCHTASRYVDNSLEEICDKIDSWHRANGWACISYHYVISQNGEIAQCNDLNASSNTVGPANYNTVCVCLDGNFEINTPTIEQLQAFDFLMNELAFNHPEFPATQEDVYGDNELGSATACPGKNMIPYVQEWRENGKLAILQNIIPESEKPQFVPVTVISPKPQTLPIPSSELAVVEKWNIDKFLVGISKDGSIIAILGVVLVEVQTQISSGQSSFPALATAVITAILAWYKGQANANSKLKV